MDASQKFAEQQRKAKEVSKTLDDMVCQFWIIKNKTDNENQFEFTVRCKYVIFLKTVITL